jgi:dTDP-4-amino-4,6-dideoxygalactose transaminase
LRIVEDAAPSLGASVGGSRVGGFGHLTCFSFHPRKSITTGEGGMITTGDADEAARLRRVRSHAASTSDLQRHLAHRIAIEEYPELGFNYRMTDIQAAIGIVQMTRLESILEERRRLARRYEALLGGFDWLRLPREPHGRRHTFQSYCVRLDADYDRNAVMAELADRGIATRRGVMAIHLEPFYLDPAVTGTLPVTEACAAETLLLPLYVGLTESEQDFIAEAVLTASAHAYRHPVGRALAAG